MLVVMVVVVVPWSGSDCVPPSSTCAGDWRYGSQWRKSAAAKKGEGGEGGSDEVQQSATH